MANTKVTTVGTLAQKKVKRVLSVHVGDDFRAQATALGAVTPAGNYYVANLPQDAVITDAYVVVDAVSNAATAATVALGTAEGGAQIMAAADVKAAVGVVGSLVGKLKTGTGMPVYMTLVYTGATTNYGSFTVVVEYCEVRKTSGEYTQF
jgi:hypothetical protein